MQELPPTLELAALVIVVKLASVLLIASLLGRVLNGLNHSIEHGLEERDESLSRENRLRERINQSHLVHPNSWKWVARVYILASFALMSIIVGWTWAEGFYPPLVVVILGSGLSAAASFRISANDEEELDEA